MNPTIEYYERSRNGKRMESAEFDDLLMDTAMDLVDEYDLDFDLDEIIASDERADAVFNAAVDFLSQVGLYNTTVKRVIPFEKDELLELAADYKANPRTVELGDGDERHLVAPRKSTDASAPAVWAGGGQVSSLDVTAIPERQSGSFQATCRDAFKTHCLHRFAPHVKHATHRRFRRAGRWGARASEPG